MKLEKQLTPLPQARRLDELVIGKNTFMIGESKWHLTVLGKWEKINKKPTIICKCECWTVKNVCVYHYVSWEVVSCWCLQRERSVDCNKKTIEYKENDNWCHICSSHTLWSRYPKITVGRKTLQLSRYIWTSKHWPIPEWLMVRHKCDTPACINIDHLELWTHEDNMRDKQDRLRCIRWESVRTAKLKEIDVIEIYSDKTTPTSNLAKKYWVWESAINRIRWGKTWKHVTRLL